MEPIAVRRVTVAARRVFNLTAPRWLPEAARAWAGRAAWSSPQCAPVRDLLEATYIAGFNRASGHYARLEESIRRNGIWNPVILTTGPLLRRAEDELPPEVRQDPERVVCEYVGGSRLLVAAKLGVEVPAIVNDRANLFPDAEVIPPGADVHRFFRDKPRRVIWNPDGSLYVNFFAYGHFPPAEQEMRRRQQIALRRRVIADCIDAVVKWSREHESP